MRTRSDSSRPWSPEEVEVAMADVAEAIEDGVAGLRSLGEEAAHKKNAYELERSKLLLQTVNHPELKSAELREAWVFEQVADLKLAYEIAAHLVASQSQVIGSLKTQADLLRSAGRSHRDMREQGWGGQPQSTHNREYAGQYG